MAVVELCDRGLLAGFLRRRAAVHAYELGDLDDFFWPRTRWYGWQPDGRVEQVALLYEEPEPPVLLALADEPERGMADLLHGSSASSPSASTRIFRPASWKRSRRGSSRRASRCRT
ncbi:MAG: hypothetical protein M5U27_02325 [Gaiella sp.]|nr:hypothetical protein [Gaiella sp.]